MTATCQPLRNPWHWFPDNNDSCNGAGGDIAFVDGDLAHGQGLKSLILMQIMTDKRRDGKRGWWGNYAMPFEIGSYLWTLHNAPRNEGTLIDAERYVRDAIDPLIGQGLAADYTVNVAHVDKALKIQITLLDGSGNPLINETIPRVL